MKVKSSMEAPAMIFVAWRQCGMREDQKVGQPSRPPFIPTLSHHPKEAVDERPHPKGAVVWPSRATALIEGIVSALL